ncbi:hypothetical protein [Candidatus Poriferisocius sp.]|uniref:hypothetical protein n=1 Tax=Candidatus Poriferisocius sp. TaxID=3101276 RepID=UPI003B596305
MSIVVADSLHSAAATFLEESWAQLEQLRVLPRPRHRPFLSFGTDYFGPDLSSDAMADLEDALVEAFPQRLAHSMKTDGSGISVDRAREVASTYIFSMLERACAYEARMPRSEAFSRAIEDLLAFVGSDTNQIATHRIVSHLKLSDPISVRDESVEIRPLGDPGRLDIRGQTGLPGLERGEQILFSQHPHVIISATGEYRPALEWAEQLEEPARRLDRAVMAIRLFRRTSARNIREWSGFVEAGAFTRPLSRSWPYDP